MNVIQNAHKTVKLWMPHSVAPLISGSSNIPIAPDDSLMYLTVVFFFFHLITDYILDSF